MNYVVVQHAELAQQVLNFIRYKFPSFLDKLYSVPKSTCPF